MNAHETADWYLKVLEPLTQKQMIVGSLRRGHDSPGDIDLLLVVKRETDSDTVLEALEWAGGRNIELTNHCMRVDDQHGFHLDLVFTSPERWGLAVLYFTGPRSFNRMWEALAQHQGLDYEFQDLPSFGDESSVRGFPTMPSADGKSEVEVLRMLGLTQFINPADREIG